MSFFFTFTPFKQLLYLKTPAEDTDELIIPGDKEEIDKFVEDATNSARIQLEIQLPSISMQLASKHIYEVLYNRINSDLLLWEPSAPKPKLPENDVFGRMGGFPVEVQDTFTMCKSGIQYGKCHIDDVMRFLFSSVL